MKITHRISFTADEEIVRRFKQLGVDIEAGDNWLVIDESDVRFPVYKEVVGELGAFLSYTTSFSIKEEKAAALMLFNAPLKGYPQPDGTFGYLDQVYDTSKYCNVCGLGLLDQKNPFRFKHEPKWGKKEARQLNWVYDEIFVTPGFYDEVFRPMGIKKREVMHHKRDKPLETVVQLCIPEVDVSFEMPLDAETLKCDTCGRVKYLHRLYGYFPPLSGQVELDIFKASTEFGTGALALKKIVITNKLYTTIVERGTKGLYYHPLSQPEQ